MLSPFSRDLATARNPTRQPARSTLAWCVAELERVQAHVDDAWTCLQPNKRDTRGAREALTRARYGTPHPDHEDPDARTEAA